VLVRCHGGHSGAVAIPLRIGSTRGGTAEVLNMFKVSAVPPRRSAVLTVFRGATAINGETTAIMAAPLRFMPYKHRNSTVEAPCLRCDGGINYRIFTDGSKEGNRVAAALVHRDNTKCVRLPDTARISSSSSTVVQK